ncbi:MAG: hypothetical protein WCK65_02535 [Rhodospirillaceae bacterium]
MNTVRKRTDKTNNRAGLRAVGGCGFNAHGLIPKFGLKIAAKTRPVAIVSTEAAEALARVVAAANLAERGLIAVTSTKDMSADEFRNLVKASALVE